MITTRAPNPRRASEHYPLEVNNKTNERKFLSTYTFADITIASNDGDLSSEHDISGTFDTVNERFAAAIMIVKLGLCDRIIDIDGGDFERSVAEGLVEVVNASSSLLRQSTDI